MIKKMINFFKDEEGATMIEYALLVSLISIAAIVLLQAIGPRLVTTFTTVRDALPAGS